MGFKNMKKFLKLIRWKDWYNSKLPVFLLAYYYLLLVYNKVLLEFLILLIPLTIFFCSLASFGYMLNDYADQVIDQITKKKNIIGTFKKWHQIIILVIFFFIGLISYIPIYKYKFALIFLIFSYMSAIFYSVSPFKLKERGIWGIISVSLAQRVFPLLIVFSIFNHFKLDTLIFVILSFFIGLRWIFIHQILDRKQDITANVETFAASKAPSKLFKILRILFIIEIITIVVLMYMMITTIFLIGPIIVAYFIYEVYLYPFWKKLGFKRVLISYDYAPLADFYYFWLPTWISILLGLEFYFFFIITFIEIIWKLTYIKYNINLIKLRREYS